nr:hypothetical protein [Tanacetum cinerariifolium]
MKDENETTITNSPPQTIKELAISRRACWRSLSWWTDDETSALIDAYCEKRLLLMRNALRESDWEEVALNVAARCHDVLSGTRNVQKTSSQCCVKMNMLKERYRLEVQRADITKAKKERCPWAQSWVHFKKMEDLENGYFWSMGQFWDIPKDGLGLLEDKLASNEKMKMKMIREGGSSQSTRLESEMEETEVNIESQKSLVDWSWGADSVNKM